MHKEAMVWNTKTGAVRAPSSVVRE